MEVKEAVDTVLRAVGPHVLASDLYVAAHGILFKGDYERSITFLESLCNQHRASSAANILMSLGFLGIGRYDLARTHADVAATLSRFVDPAVPLSVAEDLIAIIAKFERDQIGQPPRQLVERDGSQLAASALYELLPHYTDYNELRILWLPFLNWIIWPRSLVNSISTDGYGFRHTVDKNGRSITVSDFDGPEYHGFFGSSAAFGAMASGDDATIPSRLTQLGDGVPWLNFAIPASVLDFNLMGALFLRPMKARPRSFVLYAGNNELYLHLVTPIYLPKLGTASHISTFLYQMNGAPKDWIEEIGRPLVDATPVADRSMDDICDWLEESFTKSLRNWSYIAAGCGAQLYFVLQPNATWMNKRKTHPNEDKLFAAFDADVRNSYPMVGGVFQELYPWYCDMLERACRRSNVSFHNANDWLDVTKYDGRWLFADRVHMTDEGFDIVSHRLLEIVG